MLRPINVSAILFLSLAVAGCGTNAGAVPEGSYTGDVTIQTQVMVNDSIESDVTQTISMTEHVGAEGLAPLGPDGVLLQTGSSYSVAFGDLGDATFVVESINLSEKRSITSGTVTLEAGGILSGPFTTTVVYESPDTLAYSTQVSVIGERNGDVLAVIQTGSGELRL